MARWLVASTQPGRYALTEALFLRFLGLIYLAAFASLWPQAIGLFGSRGIVPLAEVLPAMRSELGIQALLELPSVFWLGSGDAAVLAVCAIGCFASLLLIAGAFSRIAAAVCWVLHLSVVSVGQPFMGFQWDALLLEVGFLALFAGSPWLVWGYRFLLFRLMFESGLVKLLSHDPNWRNLHALRYHFMTQPLPDPLSYYMYRAPYWLLDSLTALTLFFELAIPFLLFGPRLVRQIGAALLILLQVIILLTGNYAFFNWLTIALCVWGFDDAAFRSLAPLLRWRFPRFRDLGFAPALRVAGNAVVAILIALGAGQLLGMFAPGVESAVREPLSLVAPFEIVNSYGLFAVMTTTRPEIVIEGSDDQTNWREYSFRYKPGELHRELPFIAPYQPRLDWQMWFAALGTIQENEWVGHLMYRLMLGEPSVIGLMDRPPFEKPPRYLRALLYDYSFTTPAERRRTGAVWQRELRGTWFGPVSLTGR